MTGRHNKNIARKSKSSFLTSFKFLPGVKREAIYSIYAWCRHTDDITDEKTDQSVKIAAMEAWQQELENTFQGNPNSAITRELSKVLGLFPIPRDYFNEMISAMWLDIRGHRFQDWEDLINYCHGVASTVGLMSIEIFGYQNWNTRRFAEDLGIALQLTNIARDVKKDSLIDRIYLPATLMDKFEITREMIFSNRYSENYKQMMLEFSKKIREYYDRAKSHLPREDTKNMRPSLIMGEIYYRLYQKLQKLDFDIFNHVARISKFEKLIHAAKIWFFPGSALK